MKHGSVFYTRKGLLMEKVEIKFCVRPYYHDVVKKITRKPKHNKTLNKHFVRYNGQDYILQKSSDGFVVWIDEDDREKY